MKNLLLTFTIGLTTLSAGMAQESGRSWMPLENRIGVAVGIGRHTFLDQNTSPLVYQAKPKNVRLFYQMESNRFIINLDIDIKVGSTNALNRNNRMLLFEEENYKGEKQVKRFPVGGSFLAGKISLGAFYKIKSTQESTFKVAAGLSVSDQMFYPDGWTSAGLMNALSFAPKALVQHRVNEHHKFNASLALPLVGRVTRLPYHNSVSYPDKSRLQGFFQNSTWAGLQKFLAPEMSVGYDYQFSRRWGTGLTYDLNWYKVTTQSELRALSHFFRATVYHQF